MKYVELKHLCLRVANLHPETQMDICEIIGLIRKRGDQWMNSTTPLLLDYLSTFADSHKEV
jgi:hypothetical protein